MARRFSWKILQAI